MSGQLVGEVLEARAEQLADLSQAQTLALIAIAEKCHVDTRQGSVRMAYIEAAIGRSRRTAVRTLEQLKHRHLIRIVKRGYKSHGIARASIYELCVLAPFRVAQAEASACATHDGASMPQVVAPKSDVVTPNPDVVAPSLGGALDGSIDGSIDEGALTPSTQRELGADGLRQRQSGGRLAAHPTIRSAYAGAIQSVCPNCGAEPDCWCTTPDGRVRRVPCIDRIAAASLAPVIDLPVRDPADVDLREPSTACRKSTEPRVNRSRIRGGGHRQAR